MSNWADLRPTLAAGIMLAVLAAAYEYAAETSSRTAPTATAEAGVKELTVAPAPLLVTTGTIPDSLPAVPPAADGPPASLPPVALAPYAVASPTAAEPAEVASPCPAVPLRFKALKTGPVVHHYVGIVGGALASAELSWVRPDSAAGRCYLWRGGLEYQLKTTRCRRGALVLALSQEAAGMPHACGAWQLAAPLGPVLRGTWVDATGRRRPFALREDYHQSVPYAIQSLTLTGGKPATDDCYAASLARDYLHLRGNLRPAWQRLQAPALADRKRHLLAAYERYGETSYSLAVRLNDFNLLSYDTFYENVEAGGRRQNGFENGLFNLTTGRFLPLASQLRPGYAPALRLLLTNHLRRDFSRPAASADKSGSSVPLLDLPTPSDVNASSLVLTGAGLEGRYLPEALYEALGPEAEVYSIPYPLLIPYRELRPLVRPGTPLARMLRARGMW